MRPGKGAAVFVAAGKQYASRAEYESSRLRAGPVPLSDSLPKTAAELQQEAPTLVSRLRTRLGLGDDAKRRMALYLRLQKLHAEAPELVERAISEVWSAAVTTAVKPDRYFCASILRRLAELGVLSSPEGKRYEAI